MSVSTTPGRRATDSRPGSSLARTCAYMFMAAFELLHTDDNMSNGTSLVSSERKRNPPAVRAPSLIRGYCGARTHEHHPSIRSVSFQTGQQSLRQAYHRKEVDIKEAAQVEGGRGGRPVIKHWATRQNQYRRNLSIDTRSMVATGSKILFETVIAVCGCVCGVSGSRGNDKQFGSER